VKEVDVMLSEYYMSPPLCSACFKAGFERNGVDEMKRFLYSAKMLMQDGARVLFYPVTI
jgi:hypothetical protein